MASRPVVVVALFTTDTHEVNVFGWRPVICTWRRMLTMLVIGIAIGVVLPFGRRES